MIGGLEQTEACRKQLCPPPLSKADQEEVLKLAQHADEAKQALFNASADLAAYSKTNPFSFGTYCELVNVQHQAKMQVLGIEYKRTLLLAHKTNRKICEVAEIKRIYRNIIESKVAPVIIRVEAESSKG